MRRQVCAALWSLLIKSQPQKLFARRPKPRDAWEYAVPQRRSNMRRHHTLRLWQRQLPDWTINNNGRALKHKPNNFLINMLFSCTFCWLTLTFIWQFSNACMLCTLSGRLGTQFRCFLFWQQARVGQLGSSLTRKSPPRTGSGHK